MIPKENNFRSRSYLRWVAAMPCYLHSGSCGFSVVAHHLMRAQSGRMGAKVGDQYTIPLCGNHHDMLHRHGDERVFFNSYTRHYDVVLKYADMLFQAYVAMHRQLITTGQKQKTDKNLIKQGFLKED